MIFPKFPEMSNQMKADSLMRYNRGIKKSVNEHMKKEIDALNK